MRVVRIAALIAGSLWVSEASPSTVDVEIGQQSVRVNGVELRAGPRAGDGARYLSLEAAKKALGQPADNYTAGLGVTVLAWTDVGIHLQRGFRGADKGKLFKFQLWLDDSYDKDEDKHSGKFPGRVRVEGVEIAPGTLLASVRSQLETIGFKVTEDSAEKGQIRIFGMNPTKTIDRIEQWCLLSKSGE